jgi:conjugal transfer pilin signal peptidase TrbI
MNKPNKKLFWLLLIPFAFWLTTRVGYAKNITTSMPYKHFLVMFSNNIQRGDLVSFKAPPGSGYDGLNITKKVVGIPGDVVTTENRDIFINGKYIATAKEFSKQGNPLQVFSGGIIPANHYFVWVKHPDSYDSRYQEIGLIDEKSVVGISYPLW